METIDNNNSNNNSSRNIIFIIIGSVIAISICCVFFVGGIFAVVFGAIKSSTPYTEGISTMQSNEAVIQALGSPIEPGLLVTGSIETNNNNGTADLSIPISGPKGKGTLYIIAASRNGSWQYSSMEVVIDGGPTINLLGGR